MSLTMVSCFLALLFAMFVAAMFCDQLGCITKGISTIDSMKAEYDKNFDEGRTEEAFKRTGFENIKEVFGGKDLPISPLNWLWPFAIDRRLTVEMDFA